MASTAEGTATAGAAGIPTGAPRRSTRSQRLLVLGAAGLLLAAVFTLGFFESDPRQAVAVLYTLPIALVAVEFGPIAGAATALLATSLFGLWAAADNISVGPLGFVTRSTGFLLLGVLLGHFSSKLRSAYEAVHLREKQLDAILDNSTAVIYLKDRAGRYMLVNRQFEELFNASRESVAGKTDHDLFPRYMADAFRANDRKVLKEACALELEETAPGGDGGTHTYISIKFPLFDDQSPTTIPQLEKTFDDPLRHSTRRFATRQLRVLQQYLPSIDRAAGLAAAAPLPHRGFEEIGCHS